MISRGLLVIDDPAAPRKVEIETFTCCHCQRVIFLHNDDGTRKPEAETYRMCLLCMKPKCSGCFGSGCTPFEKKLEEIEHRASFFKAVGI